MERRCHFFYDVVTIQAICHLMNIKQNGFENTKEISHVQSKRS
jgi:hypothetical protein